MSTPPLPGMGSSFQEPPSPDQTSAPQINVPQPPSMQQTLSKRKKFGPNVKNPGALAAAIARGKRPRQMGDKWGS